MQRLTIKISRADAKAKGLRFYKNSKACKNGHRSRRLVSNWGCVACRLEWHNENRDYRKAYRRAHRAAHPEQYRERQRRRLEKLHIRAVRQSRERTRYASDANFKLRQCVRHTLALALRGGRKSSIPGLGCSIEELRVHLEQQFYGGMTWDNRGSVWQVDHIKTLGLFDLTDRQQYLTACHYSNLQPLLVDHHRKKNILDHQLVDPAG